MAKAKLRHIAITVNDLKREAEFYETVFGFKKHSENDVAISLSDGVMNVTLLKFKTDADAGDERGKDFVGLHHMGFVVDDLEGTSAAIEHNGGRFHRELKGGGGVDFERKFRDPNGIVFDISHKGWVGAEGQVGSETGARRA